MLDVSLQSLPLDGKVTPESPAAVPSHVLSASANLCLRPGQTKVFALTSIPREAGQVEVSSITAYIKDKDFDLELIFSMESQLRTGSSWGHNVLGMVQKPLKSEKSTAVKILPKPPKMQIGLPDLLAIYYVDEDVILDLELTNEEEEPTKGTIDVRLLGPPEMHAKLAWTPESTSNDPLEEATLEGIVEDGHQRLPTKQISLLEPGAQQKHRIQIKSIGTAVEYSLQSRSTLQSSYQTQKHQYPRSSSADLVFVQPFEATFGFAPSSTS